MLEVAHSAVITGLVAGLCMYVTDLVATMMVRCEAAGKGWQAGLLDAVGWVIGIFTTSISVSALTSHSTFALKVCVIGFVSVANVLGTQNGTALYAWVLLRRKSKLVSE